MERVTFSQEMIFRKSWDYMKKQGITMVGLYLAFIVVSMILSFVSGKDMTSGRYIVGNFLTLILSWGFGMGFCKLVLNILDGMEPKMDVFLSVWFRAWTYLKLEILILLVMAVCGMIAFLVVDLTISVPSVISDFTSPIGYSVLGVLFVFLCWFMIRISFAGIIIFDTDLGTMEALRRSWRITKGHVLELVFLCILILLLNILGFIALIIGIFFTVVMSQFVYTIAYRILWALYQEKEEPVFESVTEDNDKLESVE